MSLRHTNRTHRWEPPCDILLESGTNIQRTTTLSVLKLSWTLKLLEIFLMNPTPVTHSHLPRTHFRKTRGEVQVKVCWQNNRGLNWCDSPPQFTSHIFLGTSWGRSAGCINLETITPNVPLYYLMHLAAHTLQHSPQKQLPAFYLFCCHTSNTAELHQLK